MGKANFEYDASMVNPQVQCLQFEFGGEKKLAIVLTEDCFNYKEAVEDLETKKPASWSFFVNHTVYDKESQTYKRSGIQFTLPDGRKATLELTLFINESNGKPKVLPKATL